MKTLGLLAGAAALLATHAWAEPAPEALFGRIPAVIDASISPDGKHVALLGGTATERVVSVATIDRDGLPTSRLGDLNANSLRWIGDDHVVVAVSTWRRRRGREAFTIQRYVSLDLQAQQVATLVEREAGPIVGVLESPPRAVLLGVRSNDGSSYTVFHADPASGAGRAMENARSDAFHVGVDGTGTLRTQALVTWTDWKYNVIYRPRVGAPWKQVWTGIYGQDGYWGYAFADNAIYVEDGGDQLVRIDVDSGARTPFGPSLTYSTPSLLMDRLEGRAVGIQMRGARPEFHWLDPQLAHAYEALRRAFPGKNVFVDDWSKDRKRVVARVTNADTPAAWYLLDQSRKELSPLGEEYPELKGRRLGATQWISFSARDGLAMGAYLTLPPDAAGGRPSPLIVLPHDNYAGFDEDAFDYLTQYLAARGYAVLRPQFRGSAIFGHAFQKAGWGEWAGKVQTDLLDAMTAAAATGTVDLARTCIVGVGFGGYEALAGAAFNSKSYRCVASIGGYSNLALLLGGSSPQIWGSDFEVGKMDRFSLEAASPAKHADQVSIPVLLIQGEQDVQAIPDHAVLMADALRRAKKPVELVMLQGADHGFARPQDRIEMLARLGDFLAKNLPTAP